MAMLDELKEARAYLSNPLDDTPIIRKSLLTGRYKNSATNLHGIADFLTMICRHYLYNYSDMKDNVCTEEIRNSAIMIMRIWCGFDSDISEDELNRVKADNQKWFRDYPFAEHWLKKYHSKHLEDGPKWKKYSNEWKDKLNSGLVFAAKQNCYDSILSSALILGPLKTYYLMIKPDDLKFTKPTRNKFLKLLAVYMLQKRFHTNQDWVLLPGHRIQNWMGVDGDSSRWCMCSDRGGRNLFKSETKNGYIKVTIDQEILRALDVQLLESKPESLPKDCDVYYDTGYGKENSLEKLINI